MMQSRIRISLSENKESFNSQELWIVFLPGEEKVNLLECFIFFVIVEQTERQIVTVSEDIRSCFNLGGRC